MRIFKNEKTIPSLLMSSCLFFSWPCFSEDTPKFYVGINVGIPVTEIRECDDLAGASGYISSTSATGKIGSVNAASSTPTLELKFGCKSTSQWRFDISYMRSTYGSTKWGADFGSEDNWPTYDPDHATPFKGCLSSKTVFIAVYYSFLNTLLPRNLVPYIGIGVGPSWNKIYNIKENADAPTGEYYTNIKANTQTSIAYKLDVGVDYLIGKNFVLDLSAKFINLGSFSSGNQRTGYEWNDAYQRYDEGTSESISPYKFRSGISPILSLGLRYEF